MSKIKYLLIFCVLVLLIILMLAPKADAENNFYIKGAIIANKTNEIKEYRPLLKTNLKNASYFSPAIGIGVGYYINDSIRTDFMFEQFKILFNKESACVSFTDHELTCKGIAYIKRNTDVKSIMLNGYIDLLDRNTFKFFTGVGVGIARIKETINRSVVGKVYTANHRETDFNYSENSTSKIKNNFAYTLMIGTSMQLNPKINLELMYAWKDFGKVIHKTNEEGESPLKNRYRSHNFSTGLRFDL